MAKKILIRPVITEKSEKLSGKYNRYTFVVDKKVNKIEIRKAVEEMYGVSVESVNTLVMPAKLITRSTKAGIAKGRKSAYKKALVTLSGGDEINFYGDI
jgi:large subunit ribosomal protein L23